MYIFQGRIGLDIALQHPERVNKLVLVDSSGLGKVSRFGTALLTGFWVIRKLFRIPQPYPKFLAEEGDDPDWACVDELPNLKIPTLIIWKRHDPYLPLAIARRAAELVPDSRLTVIPGFDEPVSCCLGPSESVLVADRGHGRIFALSTQRWRMHEWSHPSKSRPKIGDLRGIAYDAARGDLLYVDGEAKRVVRTHIED